MLPADLRISRARTALPPALFLTFLYFHSHHMGMMLPAHVSVFPSLFDPLFVARGF